jgi:hypothetical protein
MYPDFSFACAQPLHHLAAREWLLSSSAAFLHGVHSSPTRPMIVIKDTLDVGSIQASDDAGKHVPECDEYTHHC